MVNVCNVRPEFFKEILAGIKVVEYRERKKIDSRLEFLRDGDALVFLALGSDTDLAITRIEKVFRYDPTIEDNFFTYHIHFTLNPRLTGQWKKSGKRIRKVQGWHRRDSLTHNGEKSYILSK